MRGLRWMAAVVAAVLSCVIVGQAKGGAYDYGYGAVYSPYPVGAGTYCPSGQCYPTIYAPTYPTYTVGSPYGTSTCPSGSCGAGGYCTNGRCTGCPSGNCPSARGNGPCGTCPSGSCANGRCTSDCPNGQCTTRYRPASRNLSSAPISSPRPDFEDEPPRPLEFRSPRATQRYVPSRYERTNGNLESPFYN